MAIRRQTVVALAISLALHLPLLWLDWRPPPTAARPPEVIATLTLLPEVPPPPPPSAPIAPKPVRHAPPQPARAAVSTSATAARPLAGELVAPAPSAQPAAPAPTIDVDAALAAARAYGRAGYGGGRRPGAKPEVPALQTAEATEAPNAIGQAIRKSEKANCREAYAGWGLLGIPLLLYDGVAEKNCKW